MSLWHLVLREIRHRKGNFLLGLLSVSVAVGCLVGAVTLLIADELRTEEILTFKQLEVQENIDAEEHKVKLAGVELEDAMRKSMKGLGFNVLILPKEQDLAALHLSGVPTATMPEKYVDELAGSSIVTVNHLLPSVTQRVTWTEKEQDVILIGTRGEVPIMHRSLKKPLLQAVPPGTMVVGYQVHKQLGLKQGEKVTFRGLELTVKELHEERGTSDDSSVWIDLKQAQELLGMQNQVNAILALECGCAADQLSLVRNEIAAILPGTQVIERGSTALARTEARSKANEVAKTSLTRVKDAGAAAVALEQQGRADLRNQREGLASILVPVVLIACAVWIGFLTYTNVRQRTSEIGILRALGLRSTQILIIFLAKALLIGIVGAGLGYVGGFGVSVAFGDLPKTAETMSRLFTLETLAIALVVAPLLSALASWIPALMAANQDPALVLQAD